VLIEFPREELLALLTANRERYASQLADAQAGYRAEIAAEARKQANLLLAWADRAERDQLLETEETHFSVYVDKPHDHTAAYDRVLATLKASDAERVELSDTDYAQYVLDHWEWRPSWNRVHARFALLAAPDEPGV